MPTDENTHRHPWNSHTRKNKKTTTKSDERSRSKYEFTGTERTEKNMLNYTTEVWWHTPDCGKVNRTEKQVSSKNKLQGKKKKKKKMEACSLKDSNHSRCASYSEPKFEKTLKISTIIRQLNIWTLPAYLILKNCSFLKLLKYYSGYIFKRCPYLLAMHWNVCGSNDMVSWIYFKIWELKS